MKNIAQYIENTLLKPNASKDEIESFLKESIKYNFHSVCIYPSWIELARKIIGKKYLITTVIGFPTGTETTQSKIYQMQEALKKGANEIDVVMNISLFKSEKYGAVRNEITTLKQIDDKIPLKVIIETAYLNNEEIKKACEIIMDSDADYVKTSTGFADEGAKLEDIKLIKSIVGDRVKIKASGGIKNFKQASEFITAGADLIGTSSGVDISNN